MTQNRHGKVSKADDTSEHRVNKQREAIKSIREGNELLKNDLAREARETRFMTNPAAIAEIQRLQEQADSYAKKTEKDRRKIHDLDRQIAATQMKVLEQRQKMGGLNASRDNYEMITKQIRTLENRLDKSMVKFNESLAQNKTLRERIDALRRERVVFDSIYKKLEKELHDKKKEMSAIIGDSNNAYHERDRAEREIMSLRQQVEKDRAEFDREWCELGKLIGQDRELRESLRQEQIERSKDLRSRKEMMSERDEESCLSDASRAGSTKKWDTGGQDRQQQQSYEAAFEKIKEATGMTKVSDMVNSFLQAEEKNFSLFNFVNDLNSEIERLEVMIAEKKNSIEQIKGQGLSTDTKRKKVLRGLEDDLAATEEKTDEYESRYQTAMKTVNQLKAGIHNIFARIGAGNNSAVEEMLGNQGVTESNMMQYLGIIEQRTSEILNAYAASQHMSRVVEQQEMLPTSPDGRSLDAAGSVPARLNVQPPGWDDFSSGEDSDQDDDERPLTRNELKMKTTLRKRDTAHVSEKGSMGALSSSGGAQPLNGKAKAKQNSSRA